MSELDLAGLGPSIVQRGGGINGGVRVGVTRVMGALRSPLLFVRVGVRQRPMAFKGSRTVADRPTATLLRRARATRTTWRVKGAVRVRQLGTERLVGAEVGRVHGIAIVLGMDFAILECVELVELPLGGSSQRG